MERGGEERAWSAEGRANGLEPRWEGRRTDCWAAACWLPPQGSAPPDLPGSAHSALALPSSGAPLQFREKKVDFAAHNATEDGGAVFLNLLGERLRDGRAVLGALRCSVWRSHRCAARLGLGGPATAPLGGSALCWQRLLFTCWAVATCGLRSALPTRCHAAHRPAPPPCARRQPGLPAAAGGWPLPALPAAGRPHGPWRPRQPDGLWQEPRAVRGRGQGGSGRGTWLVWARMDGGGCSAECCATRPLPALASWQRLLLTAANLPLTAANLHSSPPLPAGSRWSPTRG